MPVALITKAERITTGSKHGYSPEESCAFYKKWINLRSAAKTRRVRCTLTFEQYVRKAKRAGITPNQIGLASGQYQMARWTDSGNYANNSCRFVTAQENIDDKFLNGGIASHAEKIRGRTKRVDPGLAVLSDKLARHFVAVSPQRMDRPLRINNL
jgi:hypothetical protein